MYAKLENKSAWSQHYSRIPSIARQHPTFWNSVAEFLVYITFLSNYQLAQYFF